MRTPRRASGSNTRCLVLAVAVITPVGLNFPALGQDVAGVSEEEAYELIPPDLAGHKRGERSKEEPPSDLEEPSEDREWFGGLPWWEWSQATGDWAGIRRELEEGGITFEGSHTMDWWGVWTGGIEQDAGYMHLLDFNVTADLDLLWGIQGGTVFADYYSTTGSGVSVDAGDFQGLSNIETEGSVDELSELWFEQWLFDRFLRIKVGKVDANSEFVFVDAAGAFINSSAGFIPTVLALPTYPDPAMSVNVFLYPTDSLYVGMGVYDGAATVDGVATGRRGPKTFFSDSLSDDYFLIGEVGGSWAEVAQWGPGRMAIGGWYHSGDFAHFDGIGMEDGTTGLYALLEQQIWRENPEAEDDEQGGSIFFQYGFADQDVSEAQHHFGVGLVATGLIAGRDEDQVGAYLSYVDLSDAAGSMFTDNETAIELFYGWQLTPAVNVKPDLQFIINPSGDPTVDDVVVGTLRIEIVF